MTNVLGRDALLSGDSIKRELVPVPELDGEMWMRDMGAQGVLIFNARIKDIKDNGNDEITPEISFELMALAVSLSACDENGELLYSEEDVSTIASRNSVDMLLRLGSKALRISGLKENIANQLTSEVSANLPNGVMSSSSGNLPKNLRKRAKKS